MYHPLKTGLLTLTAVSISVGCGKNTHSGSVSEGTVEYAMSFPDFPSDGLMAGILPEKTILSFSAGRQHLDMSAGMGVFRTGILVNNEPNRLDYHMSVLGKRMVAEMTTLDLEQINKDSKAMSIIYTDEVDTIAGMPCRKALAMYDRVERPQVELWYTDRIELSDPNWFSPYREVPGVLLRYEMVQYGIRMRFDAVAVNAKEVDEKLFTVRTDHDRVAPNVLNHELAQVLSTFSQ